MTSQRRKTAGLVGAIIAVGVVAVVVIPGGGSQNQESGSAGASGGGTSAGSSASTLGSANAPRAAGAAAHGSASSVTDAVGVSATATRVVRSGQLSLQVTSVTSAVARLTALANASGGYVQSSDTTSESGTPEGDITLRVPANDFDTAVASAERLGRTRSLTTSATDVTGRYVDLVARATALRQTRATYLTILSKATTIGSTLSVQQRVDDVQQQLDRLEGQRKVLASQSDDATLAVSLNERQVVFAHAKHVSTGIGAAWHRSIHRFSVGFDGVVGILGPLALAVLLLALLTAIGLLGYRGMRRVFS
jgi:hypothetical protein